MTRSDGAPQFGLLPAGTAFERKWIAYEERAAAEERDVVETLRGGRGEQAASASERRDGRIVMAKRDVYEVERIDNELKYITPTVGTQTRGLGPYTTDRDIPTLGAGGETAGIWA